MPRYKRRDISVAKIKAAARARDGYACKQCGMTNTAHKEATGRQLQVHRLTPGSEYTLDGCVTLCSTCHGPCPRSPQGSADFATGEPKLRLRLPADLLDRLGRCSAGLGLTGQSLIRMMLTCHLPQYEARAEAIRQCEKKP